MSDIWCAALQRCIGKTLSQPYMRPVAGVCQCSENHDSIKLYRCTCGLKLDEKCLYAHIVDVYLKTKVIHYVMNVSL